MSIDFVVVCERPVPADLEPRLEAQRLPFMVSVRDSASWKEETREWLAEAEERGEFEDELERMLDGPWSSVVHINCRSRASDIVDACAAELVRVFGGFYYDDHSAELSEVIVAPDDATWTADRIVAAWTKIVQDEVELEMRNAAQAQKEWEEAAKRDPNAQADADDWSDV